ncbi:hypothetical protein K504DRAFT_93595 [Pleomassaria siparia CBS 279.74]|uniref:Nudix hydrolase domain-containing protein n=1 Tax=Pleomassaria siparia CBS 279.74 TaxID=1314801 RepID=A0A6G1JZD1_9PLEO|nr:hypothetical protein K504DRAFT_93595 [Pleomassaria siparia CBS 279.74]
MTSTRPFEYASSLHEFAVSEKEFLRQNLQYNVLCTGIIVFNTEGKLLLVQRAAEESAFPNAWEIPGGKVDESDETLLHGAVRELQEETGLTATKIVRKVAEFEFGDVKKSTRWLKQIFEMEVQNCEHVVLDPIEHQRYLWAGEDDVKQDRVGDVELNYINNDNKHVKLQAFRRRREVMDQS